MVQAVTCTMRRFFFGGWTYECRRVCKNAQVYVRASMQTHIQAAEAVLGIFFFNN